ncbi:cell wall-active antibiotics response protein [Dethiobacter alkaliphilus]|uniref:cell wall-active antibiotics response protein n=1 Tax=Dethiobacter alkaliphilus TaxID=427926 RepID=UPI00222675F1|nr:cell wall-active antibiotics response protein [Dethiobacter alkaliphilus]MCW3490635.1 cell wall-active antibiotics response protein [Dethiobacter alkaliphilus]
MTTDKSRTLWGIIVIAAGIVLLLNNLEFTDINIFRYWPVLLILWGLNALFTGSRNLAGQGISIFVIIVGAVLLANSLGHTDIGLGEILRVLFPLLIILVGVSLFLGRSVSGKTTSAIMGGVERGKKNTWHLENGSYLAFMGGIELDLRHAIIPEGETFLDLTAIMGGIEIRVPADLPVEADGFAVLGGVEFFGEGSGGIIGSARYSPEDKKDNTKILKIQSRAVMGGIDIKRV